MALTVIDCEQGSDRWYRERLALPTASRFKDVLAEGKGYTRATYMRQLAGETLTGRPMETFSNHHMERGREHEPIALAEYSFLTGNKLERVGFAHNGIAGCSPDSLCGTEGAVETKSALPHIMVEMMLRPDFPPEHRAQTQGTLWIFNRKWLDLVIYCHGAPLHIRRTFRDERYIAELERECIRFRKELAEMVAKIKGRR